MKTAIVNIGTIVTGDLASPIVSGDSILMDDGKIIEIGTLSSSVLSGCDVVVDAGGKVAIPGLIDSHVHITFGDYTPRQRTVGLPGELSTWRHNDLYQRLRCSCSGTTERSGRRQRPDIGCSCLLRALSPRLHACSCGLGHLEPGLTEADLQELMVGGVWLAKAGFGEFATPFDYAPPMQAARRLGMTTTMHTGGSSIPGSFGIWAEHVLASNPSVSFHVNGGPAAMPEEGAARLVNESKIVLQLCTAGNLRTPLLAAKFLTDVDQLDRLLIPTDTRPAAGSRHLACFIRSAISPAWAAWRRNLPLQRPPETTLLFTV